MRALRRALLALAAAALAAAIVRLRGSGGTPPRGGGWRQLSDAELVPLAPPTDPEGARTGSRRAGDDRTDAGGAAPCGSSS
ncbi:MAG: hypothetical protein ACRDY0_06550 [Acidimicrobiales bacterium]